MRKATLWLLAVVTLGPAIAGAERKARPTHITGEVLIRFADTEAERTLTPAIAAMGRATVQHQRGVRRIRLDPATTVAQAVVYLRGLDGIELAQPNYLYYPAALPNDPDLGQQWAAQNSSQTITQITSPIYAINNPGQPGADMGLAQAWDVQTDCRGVIVAVIDSGVEYTHADLAGAMWDGTPTYPNHGWDFVDNDADPKPDLAVAEDDHGTHVAGIIGAVGNNATGTSGVCWNAEIMAIRAGGFLTGLSTADVIDSIEFAVDNGASLLNLSFGGELPFDTLFSNAIDYARAAGVLVVAAAGNGGFDGIGDDIDGGGDDGDPATRYYPCAFPQDNLVCIAASDQAHQQTFFSNFGSQSVDTAAPGTNIISATYTHALDVKTGTSMATPQATGIAALVWAQNPVYGYLDVRAALLSGGNPVPGWGGLTVSGQVVSGDGAVRHVQPPTGLSFTLD
jgi:subtilisin family serine protease